MTHCSFFLDLFCCLLQPLLFLCVETHIWILLRENILSAPHVFCLQLTCTPFSISILLATSSSASQFNIHSGTTVRLISVSQTLSVTIKSANKIVFSPFPAAIQQTPTRDIADKALILSTMQKLTVPVAPENLRRIWLSTYTAMKRLDNKSVLPCYKFDQTKNFVIDLIQYRRTKSPTLKIWWKRERHRQCLKHLGLGTKKRARL